jgi:hypothetical protein
MNEQISPPSTNRDVFVLGLLIVIAVITWVGLEAYRRFATTTVPPILQEQLAPINPQLDTDFLTSLRTKSKTDVSSFQHQVILPDTETTSEVTPEITPEITPEDIPEVPLPTEPIPSE